jgi:GNAT superfamily N-acetyltransferase
MLIRRMLPEEKDAVWQMAKASNRFVKDLGPVWTRFGLWESNPPFVAVVDGKIVGFHAMQFLKKDYCYTYFIGTLPEARGLGAAKALTWAGIEEAKKLGLTRFTAKADTRGDGYKFYTSLGMKPVARTKNEYTFDCEFSGCNTLEEFREALQSGTACTPPSERRKKLYLTKSEERWL